eukprot:364303-Chlamydomonas_euryale.AAC.1
MTRTGAAQQAQEGGRKWTLEGGEGPRAARCSCNACVLLRPPRQSSTTPPLAGRGHPFWSKPVHRPLDRVAPPPQCILLLATTTLIASRSSASGLTPLYMPGSCPRQPYVTHSVSDHAHSHAHTSAHAQPCTCKHPICSHAHASAQRAAMHMQAPTRSHVHASTHAVPSLFLFIFFLRAASHLVLARQKLPAGTPACLPQLLHLRRQAPSARDTGGQALAGEIRGAFECLTCVACSCWPGVLFSQVQRWLMALLAEDMSRSMTTVHSQTGIPGRLVGETPKGRCECSRAGREGSFRAG